MDPAVAGSRLHLHLFDVDIVPLRKEIDTLKTMPERCPYAPENGLWGNEELRQLLFQQYPSKYRIIYTVQKNKVQILNIRHGARRFLHEE